MYIEQISDKQQSVAVTPSRVKLSSLSYPVSTAHRPSIPQLVSLNTSSTQTHQHGHTQAPVCPGSTVQHRPLSYRGQANSSHTAGALHGLGQRGPLERTFTLVFTLMIHNHFQDVERVECSKIALLSKLWWAFRQKINNINGTNSA